MKFNIHPLYEASLVGKAWRLFGSTKAIEFALLSPFALVRGGNRYVYERIRPCTTSIDGVKAVFVHPDVRFIDEIVTRRCYTSDPSFNISETDTVVDLGANIGVFTLLAGIRARKGIVIAVEPSPENYRFLVENLRANNLGVVKTWQGAVSGLTGNRKFRLGKPGSGSLVKEGESGKRDLNVETTSMTDLFARFRLKEVDLLKMDTEGSEFEIFGDTEWLRYVTRIVMEVHTRLGDELSIVKVLERGGFRVKLKKPIYDRDTNYIFALRAGVHL